MNTVEFTLVVAIGSFFAGMLGSLTGLGGGVVIVPLLTLVFGVDIRYAIGASLVSVIATSSGAAAAYLREGYSNMRGGMFLDVATTVGALSGAFIAGYVSSSAIAIIFGVVLLYSAYTSFGGPKEPEKGLAPDPVATFLRLDGTFPADRVRGAGDAISVAAGATTFTFDAPVADGSTYSVAVKTQPTGLACASTAGTGTMAAGNVTSVALTCAARPRRGIWAGRRAPCRWNRAGPP